MVVGQKRKTLEELTAELYGEGISGEEKALAAGTAGTTVVAGEDHGKKAEMQ